MYLFSDLLDQCEQLDEFDSEDESETSDDNSCKKSNISYRYLSSDILIPEQ